MIRWTFFVRTRIKRFGRDCANTLSAKKKVVSIVRFRCTCATLLKFMFPGNPHLYIYNRGHQVELIDIKINSVCHRVQPLEGLKVRKSLTEYI